MRKVAPKVGKMMPLLEILIAETFKDFQLKGGFLAAAKKMGIDNHKEPEFLFRFLFKCSDTGWTDYHKLLGSIIEESAHKKAEWVKICSWSSMILPWAKEILGEILKEIGQDLYVCTFDSEQFNAPKSARERAMKCAYLMKMNESLFDELDVVNYMVISMLEWMGYRKSYVSVDELSGSMECAYLMKMNESLFDELDVVNYMVISMLEWMGYRKSYVSVDELSGSMESGVSDICGCMWIYLADLRMSEGCHHAHYNLFYDRTKYDGSILPPAAALAPTLWPQFHLRWACPSEAQAGELEVQCRNMANKFTEIQKAKEMAESKAKDVITSMESLTAELLKERQLSSSAMDLAKRACRESLAIKRAIQSLGCKVHFSNSGGCGLDIVNSPLEAKQKLLHVSQRQPDGDSQEDEKSDLSVSISLVADNVVPDTLTGRQCEALCPFRTREGGCKWPDAECAQFASQFVGLTANFDAFDRLSIYDCYFGSE
ncbi:hypothetical protein ACLOJK_030224 [Asimina triloba]